MSPRARNCASPPSNVGRLSPHGAEDVLPPSTQQRGPRPARVRGSSTDETVDALSAVSANIKYDPDVSMTAKVCARGASSSRWKGRTPWPSSSKRGARVATDVLSPRPFSSCVMLRPISLFRGVRCGIALPRTGGEGPPRRRAEAQRRGGEREGESKLSDPDLEPEAEWIPSAPRMTSGIGAKTSVARLPAHSGERVRARGFASQPLSWFALVVSSFGAQHHTFEVAFGPVAPAIFRRNHGLFRQRYSLGSLFAVSERTPREHRTSA